MTYPFKTTIASGLLLIAAGMPAYASGGIACSAIDKSNVSLEIGLGSLPVLQPHRIDLTIDEKTWSTEEGKDAHVLIGQAFGDDDKILIDLTDDNVNDILVSIRLYKKEDETTAITLGTVEIADKGLYAISCVGP
jgi:hypothetical protein